MASNFDLAGRRAVVTGASSGIGQALATGLAEAGAEVLGVARRLEALQAWQSSCQDKGLSIEILAADLGAPDQADQVGSRILKEFGGVDILINAAGLNPRQPADTVSIEDWQKTIDINLSTPFFLSRSLKTSMKERGNGRIINIASLQSERAFPNGIAYGASKGGVAQLTRAMAEAWSHEGVMCNAIAPGFFPTELTQKVFENQSSVDQLAAQTCVGRNGKLEDLIGPAVFLASDAAHYVTGQVLFVDGGFTAK